MIRFFFLLFFFYSSRSIATSTSEILAVIGKSPTDIDFLLLKNKLKLDRNFANAELGIKYYLNENRQKIVSVLFANDSLDIDKQIFNQYNGDFDFPFSFKYSIYQVKEAMGTPINKTYNAISYKNNGYLVDVFFTDPTILEKVTYILVSSKPTDSKDNESLIVKDNRIVKEDSELKIAILKVFKASQDPSFASICKYPVRQSNIWNYTHTLSTSIDIQDELYNFVYSFPFSHSQRDFVSVLAEQKDGSSARNTFYSFEQKMTKCLTSEDGWRKNYDNTNKNSNLPYAVTFSKPSLGEVILDYTKSPKGVEVVYLRFLFQYQ